MQRAERRWWRVVILDRADAQSVRNYQRRICDTAQKCIDQIYLKRLVGFLGIIRTHRNVERRA